MNCRWRLVSGFPVFRVFQPAKTFCQPSLRLYVALFWLGLNPPLHRREFSGSCCHTFSFRQTPLVKVKVFHQPATSF